MSSEARARRLGERIREELADLLRREVADPRARLPKECSETPFPS